MFVHGFKHRLPLRLRQPRHLACDPQRGQSVDPAGDEQIEHAAHAIQIQRAIVQKRCGQDRKNTLHR